jgi:uncharacterized circularly permuted ATP-grasp superfamily protein/uncharacterized alpha-E superfamily protein
MAPDDSTHAATELARTYPRPGSGYDELLDERGLVRAHYRQLLAQLDALGHDELDRRWEKARQLLHDNGVSYNVYGDPKGMERPWQLSPLPVVLAPAEHQRIDAGIRQRARLLEALLADLYGPQRTLLDRLLPPALVFGNPGFLRACHGLAVPRHSFLPLYAADLMRAADGTLLVADDRTQAPSGAGYTLENRIVVSSVLPEAFRECNVERLAPFFRALREMLQALAPHNRDNPRIVLLTPGPYNATYFEQAYLAQYLGYTLVDGADLTIRNSRVFLKTLGGLQRVDVILRRIDDDFCDPLELRPDSLLGVPGLVQAARAGNVALANPLGSGVLQTPAMLGYLPRLCRALLGEELALPSIRSFYCGDPDALREAEAIFDDAVVKPTYPRRMLEPIVTTRLSREQRAELLDQVRAQPSRYVVQEHVPASLVPQLEGHRLVPRTLTVRVFAVAGRHEHLIMPGGLARVGLSSEGPEALTELGEGSKDVWMIADGPVTEMSLLPPSRFALALSRGGSDLPSRSADNLYWLGRYAERAECVTRLARVLCGRLRELSDPNDLGRSTELVALSRALTAQTSLLYTAKLDPSLPPDLPSAQRDLLVAVFDETVPGSLRAAVSATLRTGRLVRDRISSDTWRVLASLEDELQNAERDLAHDRLSVLHEALLHIVLRLSAFSGLVMDSMTRGHAWRFLDMGRRVERAMGIVTLLRATLIEPSDREGALLEATLDTADSAMTYRRRYLSTLQVAPVVDLLLVDETNPRSVQYQVEALCRSLSELPRPESGLRSPEERRALALLATLRLCDVEASCVATDGTRSALSALLVDLATRIPALSDALSDRYLAHASISRHLGYDETVTGLDSPLKGKG